MIEYMCVECKTTYDLTTKESSGAARRKHACTRCNDVTTFERVGYDLSEMSDIKREFLRNVNPEVAVSKKSTTDKRLHIVDGGGKLCNVNTGSLRTVPIEQYPKGYADWCSHCLEIADSNSVKAGSQTSKESCIKAIRYANEKVDGRITCEKYRDLEITPSVYTIKYVCGNWSTAKEQALE